MPCCVPGCSGSVRLVQFPSDNKLKRRWRDAIALATGTIGPPAGEEQSQELCEDHFEIDPNSTDSDDHQRYREPVRFNDRTGQSVELGSCRLCHRIEVASRLYSLDGPNADADIGTALRESVKVQFQEGDFLRFICGACLTQVGMVLTIQKSFLIKEDPGAGNPERSDPLMEVTCCRLCRRYEPTDQMCFLDDALADGVTIGSTLSAILQSETDLAQLICLACLAKIDMMQSIQSFFAGKDGEFLGWQRDGLVTVDLDCNPELMLEVKVEPVEFQEPVETGRKRRAKGKLVKEKVEPVKVQETVRKSKKKKMKGKRLGEGKPQIECKICDKKFKKKHSLNFHMLLHTGELPHKCSHCDASFRMSTDLSKHVMGVHEGKTPYDCKECDLPLATKADYYRHRKMAHSTGYKRVAVLYRCLVCETTCQSIGELRNHIAALHENYPYLECPECPTLQLTCAAHVRVHGYYKHPDKEPGERFVCDKCGKEFGKKALLQKHVRSVHTEPGTTKEFSCSQCDKTFRLYSTYHRHKDTHSGTKRYACEICNQKFSQSTSLKYHVRNVHTLEKPFCCEDCGDSFRSSALFNKHRADYHPSANDSVKEKVPCPICHEECLTRSLLQRHVKTVHEERKDFKCLECGKSFVNFANLKRHRDTHNETRRHPCNFCDKSFTQQISLRNHIRNRHTGEAPFMCSDCGETFKDSSAFYKHRANLHAEAGGQPLPCESCGEQFEKKTLLLKHRRSAHPELNQLICSECGKLFSSSSTLRRHKETHSGTRKHHCSFCEMSFTQLTPLKNHIRNRHTGETPFACEQCGEAFRDSSMYYRHRAKCQVEVSVVPELQDPLGDDP